MLTRFLLTLALVPLGASTAAAASLVTDCSSFGPGTGSLQAALAAGGTIDFACSGVIVMSEVLLTAPTILDARGETVVLSGGGANRLFSIPPGLSLELRDIELVDGATPAATGGGAILNDGGSLLATGTVLCDHTAVTGGAISSLAGSVTLLDSTLCRNTASDAGGAVAMTGISALEITRSVLFDNTAVSGFVSGTGGAIYVNGIKPSRFDLANSTLSGNTAGTAGGGAFLEGDLTATITHSTLTLNDDYGLYLAIGSDVKALLANTIVADNLGLFSADCGGSTADMVDNGSNLDGDGSCGWSEATSSTGDPLLAPLADQGGPTLSHALLPTSPAIDAGDTTLCQTLPVASLDQRGKARPDGMPGSAGSCDIGAYEVAPPDCSDGLDNDGDGEIDFGGSCQAVGGADCGCASANDVSERDTTGSYLCDDGLDNDHDGLIDWDGGDPGCFKAAAVIEDPACNDGDDNDADSRVDFDGGAAASQDALLCSGVGSPFSCCTGPGLGCDGVPDAQCSQGWRNRERPGCGIGFELLVLMAPLAWLARRRRSRR